MFYYTITPPPHTGSHTNVSLSVNAAPPEGLHTAASSTLLLQDKHSAILLNRIKSLSGSESLSSALKQLFYLELTSSFFAIEVDDCATTIPFNDVST